MCRVVAYKRLKTIKSYDVVTLKSGRGRWSFTRGFKYRALTVKRFGVLDRWSLTRGGRMEVQL